ADVVAAKTWRGRLGVLFAPPGWREDGEHQTVGALMAARSAAATEAAPPPLS
ncbi:MAG: sterol desaturase family protein, partial [Myxococcales bacterium]|nr:sterol desaturase family protein [Myxococcales bacterium]